MANILFVITLGFLLSTHCVINCQRFSCFSGYINVAFVYDCRYGFQLQQDFFTQFSQVFKPLNQIISNTKVDGWKPDVTINLMTYTEYKLIIFEKFTKKNFTLVNFNEATLKLNTSSCPEHLPLKTVFKDTREALGGYSSKERKLAIFVLHENLTDYENDDAALQGLETGQGLNGDIERVFILIKPRTELKEKGVHSLYANTLNNPLELVKKITGKICNKCHKNVSGYKHGTSCYYRTHFWKENTPNQVEEKCQQFHGSHLVYINSQSELEYLTSIVEFHLSYNKFTSKKSKSDSQELVAFIGLSSKQSNNPEDYTWNDGTPLVVDAPWDSSNEGQGCVYMSLKYTLDDGVIRREEHQWIQIDCNKTKRIKFAICESDMRDVKLLSLNLKELTPNKQESYSSLLYTSYSHLLFNHIHDEMQNNVMSLIKEKISYKVIQKRVVINCQISKDGSENDHSTHITQVDQFIKIMQRKNPACKIKIIDNKPELFNEDSYIQGGLRYNETKSNFLNEIHFDVKYLNDSKQTVQKCLYEIDTKRRRVGFPHNAHLQDCDQVLCPPGFVKCPVSYCIPVYLVDDDVKDCPQGEDEISINHETSLCTGKLKFTLKNICLQQQLCKANDHCVNRTNDSVCQVPCDTGYVCVSNIMRKETVNNTTFYISFVENTVQIFDDLGVSTFTPQIYSLFPLFKLVEVDLSNCRIRDLDNVIESLDISDVIILNVSHNSFSEQNNISVIQEMKNLQKLNMSFNKHLELDENFIFPLHLQVLDLSYTKCGSGVIKNLINFTNLKVLELRNVEPIDLSLTGTVKLDILDVRGTELIDIKGGYLSWLSIQIALYTDDFRICCKLISGDNIPENKCHAQRDAISTCQDLIGDPQKRVILWVVGILSLFGNMVVVIYRIIWDRAVFNKAYGLFVVCLGVSDLIMGVYLIIIAVADLLYRNMYVLKDSNWRYSDACKLAGILSTFSSETSTMFICLITLDRYLVLKYPFGQHRFSKTGKITSLCLTFIIGVVVSVIPVLFPDWEIYSSNGMCLALPFSSGRHTGWEYSAVLFVGLNFFLFILIAIGQLAIFLAITSYKGDDFSTRRDVSRKAEDLAIAKQLFIVALSDFCCWFPIGIMGIMSLNGFQFNLDVYAWSAVLVLPVNSAINPLIYTLPAILRKIKNSHEVSK